MDGTEGQEDALQKAGQSPTGDAQGTSEKPNQEAQTYTEDQVSKMVSDALAKAGRDAKSFDLREKSLTEKEQGIEAAQAEVAKWQKEREDAELEAIRNNPEAVDWFNKKKALEAEKKALQNDKSQLARERAEWAETLRITKETQREIDIWQIATEHKVDPDRLKNLSTRLGIEDKGKLAELAQEIASGQVTPKPDSGMTKGAGKDLSTLSTRDLIARGLAQKK